MKKLLLLLVIAFISCETDENEECLCYDVTNRTEVNIAGVRVATIEMKDQCNGNRKTLTILEGEQYFDLDTNCEYCEFEMSTQSTCR